MVEQYVPEQGDIVILSFDPQSGHEQKGRRPAIIVSNKIFNRHVKLALACPITNTQRGFPFHVKVESSKITGFIMAEQVKSIDYRTRKAKFVEKAKPETLETVLALLESITAEVKR